MKRSNYRVLVSVANADVKIDGAVRKLGFFTTRYVSAHNDSEASENAVAEVQGERKYQETILNDPSDPVKVSIEEVEKLGFFYLRKEKPGYAFYEE